ncbi:cysteine-rich secretory protein 3-like [Lineus longissimus]|uniref:cysteine-rich secretory protein 3-like n=1 Tax=Lineus longissimus TaxID=88925 RepID=UPI00315C9A8C
MGALRNTLLIISSLLLTLSYCNGQFTETQKQELLDRHNKGRRLQKASDMNELAWDDALASEGQKLAETCVGGHVTVIVAGIDTVGQNLFWRQGASNPLNAYDAWYGEIHDYNKDTNTCNKDAKCGHYRMVVLNTLTKVGCGFKVCPSFKSFDKGTLSDVTYVVCHYDDAPLVSGAVFTAGSPCRKCLSGKFWCNKNLCRTTCTAAGSNCECYAKYDGVCSNCGAANEADCTCKCADGYLGKYCTEKCEDLPTGTNIKTSCTADIKDDPEYFCIGDGGKCCPYIKERTCRATCAPFSKLCVALTPALKTAATTGCTQTKPTAPVAPVTDATATSPSDPCKNRKCTNGKKVTEGAVCKCQCDAKWQGTSCDVTVSGGQTINANILCVGLQVLLIFFTFLRASLA